MSDGIRLQKVQVSVLVQDRLWSFLFAVSVLMEVSDTVIDNE